MDADDPRLFDLPAPTPPTLPERLPRGRNRETWTCMATAEVTITDAAAVRAASARAEENAMSIGLSDTSGIEDLAADSHGAGTADDAFDALAWLIWPTEGLEPILEVGAVRILEVDSEVEAESVDRGRLTWAVTVKLIDVQELRRIATRAHPEETELIADSLAVAWQCAVDPFAPLRPVPGIAWQPGQVEVRHLPARGRRH
jgi:hypothetical protein